MDGGIANESEARVGKALDFWTAPLWFGRCVPSLIALRQRLKIDQAALYDASAKGMAMNNQCYTTQLEFSLVDFFSRLAPNM